MMGNGESIGPPDRYAPARNQLVSRTAEPDQFQVLRVRAERREIEIGGQRLEAERVNITAASGSGGNLHVREHQRTEIRVQSRGLETRGLEWRSPRLMLDASDDDDDDESKCTYDDDGPGFLLQPWFKCYTCWGNDADESCFGCCSHCASTCHQGHRLERSGLQKSECDCGQNRHQTAVCTWHVTQRNYVRQPFYRCFDCFNEADKGVCYQCWKICHRTHNTSYIGVIPAFCDCGLSCCRIKCTIPGPK